MGCDKSGEDSLAKREITDAGALEEVDIEVRNPTVVMSVRLDGETARAVGALARAKGRKVSEILREAAVAYAAAGGETEVMTFELKADTWGVRMGPRTAMTSGRGLTEGNGGQSFGVAMFDTAALSGPR